MDRGNSLWKLSTEWIRSGCLGVLALRGGRAPIRYSRRPTAACIAGQRRWSFAGGPISRANALARRWNRHRRGRAGFARRSISGEWNRFLRPRASDQVRPCWISGVQHHGHARGAAGGSGECGRDASSTETLKAVVHFDLYPFRHGTAYGPYPGPRSTFPGSLLVILPWSTTGTPFTRT